MFDTDFAKQGAPRQILRSVKRKVASDSMPTSAPPAPLRKAANLASAGIRILKAAASRGPIRVTAEVLAQRDAACTACDLWKPSGNLGMGECTHPQCGCTKMKRGFATEACPLGKWHSIE